MYQFCKDKIWTYRENWTTLCRLMRWFVVSLIERVECMVSEVRMSNNFSQVYTELRKLDQDLLLKDHTTIDKRYR